MSQSLSVPSPNDLLLSNFFQAIYESVLDNESIKNIERIMALNEQALELSRNDFNSNINLLFIFLQQILIPIDNNNNNSFKLDEQRLTDYSKLMQKLIIQDDYHMLDFLSKLIEYFHYSKNLKFDEINRIIYLLNFEKVLPTFICNHWFLAQKPNGQSATTTTTTLDRLQIIKTCILFKSKLIYSNDFDDLEQDDD